MSTGRASIFEPDDDDVDVAGFAPAPTPRPRDPKAVAAVRETAESKGFVSRESAPAPAPAAPTGGLPATASIPQEARLRRRRTGRDKQINLKVTEDSLNRFYSVADSHHWGLGETFERALAALEAELKGAPNE